MRRKVNILIAVVVFITAGVIGVLQYQKETGWRRRGRQEETWNTRESMDTSKIVRASCRERVCLSV